MDITTEQQKEIRAILEDFRLGFLDVYQAEYKIFTLIAKTLGSRGGTATKAKHGREHYVRLAANMNRKKAEKKAVLKSKAEGGVLVQEP